MKRLFFRNEKHKRAVIQPFSIIVIYSFIFTVLSIYKHDNSELFPCLYHIPCFSTAFSVTLILFSPKPNNILLLFTTPFYTITETPDFCVIVYFFLIVRFSPQSPSYQRHQKRKKERPTNHSGEPLYAQNPLILSHSSILSPVSTKNPMASFGNSRLCRCYTLMTFTPLYPIYPTQFDFRQTGFDKIPLLLCGIRHKMISAERSAAFDRCGGICYNENTKGNTADRRSVPKVSYKNSNRVPRPKGGYFFV